MIKQIDFIASVFFNQAFKMCIFGIFISDRLETLIRQICFVTLIKCIIDFTLVILN